MISVETARNVILEKMPVLPKEKLFILDALNRFLAEDITSNQDVPAWNNSAMDGYAIRAEDIKSIPQRLPVSQNVPAGRFPEKLKPETAAKIMTGAPIPEGSNSVVMREDTIEDEGWVEIRRMPKINENIRFAGEDIKKGSVVVKAGTHLNPSHIGLLSSIGKSMIYCHQVPSIAILSTGDEIGDLDDEATPGRIFSSNTYSLLSLVRQAGAEPINLGIARDNRKHLEECLLTAKRADLILTSGGVSIGDFDLVKDVLASGENSMEFWKVAMKPGKPLAFGNIAGIPAIGLPGNPVSVVVGFYQFVRPAILKMAGSTDTLLPCIMARLEQDIKKKTDRPHYIRGILSLWPEPAVRPFREQGSGILSTMASSNCLIVLPAEVSLAAKDTLVKCEIFNPLTV